MIINPETRLISTRKVWFLNTCPKKHWHSRAENSSEAKMTGNIFEKLLLNLNEYKLRQKRKIRNNSKFLRILFNFESTRFYFKYINVFKVVFALER